MQIGRSELGELSFFAVVARHRSFKAAGRELGVSASALSQTLRSLEERFGIRLLNRTTRAVVPTEAGQELLEKLEPALRGIAEAVAAVRDRGGEASGTLRLNVTGTAARLVCAPLVGAFLARHPRVRLEIVTEDRMVDIVAGGFDAGIRFGDTVPRDMAALRIGFAHRFAVVGSPAYFAATPRPATPADLARHRCIRWAFTNGGYMRWRFEKGDEAVEIDVDGPLAANETEVIRQAALDGVGLAYQLEQHLAAPILDGRLVRVLEDWCPPRPGFSLYYPRQRQVPAALRAFIDVARDAG